MFESAELGHSISKRTFAREEPKLREALLDAQYDLFQDGRFPVVVLIGGVDGAGKGETVNLFNEWMDPRHIRTEAFGLPSDEERERPPMWRYWRALPSKGKIGILFGHWYTDPITERAYGRIRQPELVQRVGRIVNFERMLADEGVLLLKFWFHLSRQAQKKRLKSLEKDPRTRWRISDTDWEHFRRYDKFRKAAEFTLRETSSDASPWVVVEGTDPNYRSLATGRRLLAAMRERLDRKSARKSARKRGHGAPPQAPATDGRNVIAALDLSHKLERRRYEDLLDRHQARLNALSRHPRFRERSVTLVFEGQDAAGKGSTIRRISRALDARQYRIIPVAAPSEEERAQPYLWRFWRHVPRLGRFSIFDRSWYGRVLVERVEGFASEFDWMRAYQEINEFEEQLAESGGIVVKFWLAISKEEQYRRFRKREKTAFKRFKITPEDWRNRKKWQAYESAVCDMVDRTSTDVAPWTLVEADDKLFARIKVLKTICERIEETLDSR